MTAQGETGRILIVDDEPRMAEAVATALRRSGHACRVATRGDDALALFAHHGADVVITDRRMPGLDGLELMRRLLAQAPELPVLLITAYADVRSAVEAMRDGAFDYLAKPFDNDELRALVARALELGRLRRENRALRRVAAERVALVAESAAMRQVLELVDRAADSRASVLVTGETGTGKERIARRLHRGSDRADSPFVAVNCRAFAPGVLESELFGHEKGAFTGAATQRIGCFERADGGTLFLDEIGDVEPDFQAKLLRVLQEGELLRVGGAESVRVDVRIVAATHRDLKAEIAAGRFRDDLFYRLAVLPVHLPPLRVRRDDILPLARHFLQRHGSGRRLAPAAEEVLLAHAWPGNVRELENTIERAMVLARCDAIEVHDLWLDQPTEPDEDASTVQSHEGNGTLQETLDRAAAVRIRAALAAHDGRRAAAAAELGVDRSTLFRMMKRLAIDDLDTG
ncbi:MAG: sigma-54 dependent transcriptional regulator [Acidobacteriota bacterium]